LVNVAGIVSRRLIRLWQATIRVMPIPANEKQSVGVCIPSFALFALIRPARTVLFLPEIVNFLFFLSFVKKSVEDFGI